MKIIPYFIDHASVPMRSFAMNMVRIRVLLEGGTKIWTDDSITTTIEVVTELLNNDIYGTIKLIEEGVCWVEVNGGKTPLSDFYTFEEVQEKSISVDDNALLWRTFRTIVDHNLILHPDLPEHELFRKLIRSSLNVD